VEDWMEQGAVLSNRGDDIKRHDEVFRYALATLREKTHERKWDGELTLEERNAGKETEDMTLPLRDSAVIDDVLVFMSRGKR